VTARLAFVITDSGIGGTEKALLTVLQRLDRSRFRPAGVIVIKGRREMVEAWEATGVPVHTIGMGRWPTPWALSKLRRILSDIKPDLVHAFLYHAIQFSRLASRNQPWPLVTSPRVNYRFASPIAIGIDRALRKRDAMSLSESRAGRQTLIDLGYPPEQVRVAENGVDVGAFERNSEARERLRREWAVAPGEVIVGAIGRLHRQKGFDLLMEAAAHLIEGPVKFRVVIAGAGPERAALTALAARLGVPTLFLGERTDVPAVLSAFDIFVQSSRYEGMSNALIEAMAAGLPCAATAVDGTLDFSRDGENLVLVRPEDSVALGVAVGFLLEKPDLRRRLAENAIITARNLSVERMVGAFHEAYQTVIPQRT
jgi:glycosyltransferase involved in cell wall biosynthesis